LFFPRDITILSDEKLRRRWVIKAAKLANILDSLILPNFEIF
jgi:hypothetical protein